MIPSPTNYILLHITLTSRPTTYNYILQHKTTYYYIKLHITTSYYKLVYYSINNVNLEIT